MESKKVDIEERLVRFAVMILKLAEKLPDTRAGRYFHDQLIRSGVSPALNYGEAKSAESASDFIHKMKVCLKELRETLISLKIIRGKPLIKSDPILDTCFQECDELVSIFVKSIQTAQLNKNNKMHS